MNGKPSPCESCTKFKRPQECHRINCEPWMVWWKARWDATCLFLLARLK